MDVVTSINSLSYEKAKHFVFYSVYKLKTEAVFPNVTNAVFAVQKQPIQEDRKHVYLFLQPIMETWTQTEMVLNGFISKKEGKK